jgi:ABC-type Fe3+-hydroxamate transport system substrate-binding protein
MTKTYIDQMKREVTVVASPFRIVSLVPSQTELLVDLGLEDRLVGITKFCIHPKGLKERVQVVGGTKKLHLDKIRALKPDLIIGNMEENTQSEIEVLSKEFPVWMSDIYTLDHALEMIAKIGELTETSEKAYDLISHIQSGFQNLDLPVLNQRKVAYFIWKDPWMCAGTNTFIDDILMRLGFENHLIGSRYPECDLHEISPDYIFLSSEPYPFTDKHVQEMKTKFPNVRVLIVDGEYFSWYGSRLATAPNYFRMLLQDLAQS